MRSLVVVATMTRHDLPGWMRVDELMRYSRAFYPAWDDQYAE